MRTEYVGEITQIDSDGNEHVLFPKVKTDAELTNSGQPADAKAVGDKLNSAIYIESFDATTGVLNTRSADYNG